MSIVRLPALSLLALCLVLPVGVPASAKETPKPAKDAAKKAAGKEAPAKGAEAKKAKAPKGPRQLKVEEYGKWERLGQWGLSPDGAWLAFQIRKGNGENALHLRAVTGDAHETVPYATGQVFSDDSRFVAFRIGVSPAETEKLKKMRKPPPAKIGLRDLKASKTEELDGISSFAFSEKGRFLALRKSKPKGQAHGGADLIVRNLATGESTTFGNVGSFAWSEAAPLLAMTIDAHEKVGNGVQLFHAGTGRIRTLDSEALPYKRLVWRKDASDLAVLRERKRAKTEDDTYVVLAWRDLVRSTAKPAVFDHVKRKGFPKKQRVVDLAGLRWTEDGKGLVFGVKAWEKRPKPKKGKDAKKAPAVKKPDTKRPESKKADPKAPAKQDAAKKAPEEGDAKKKPGKTAEKKDAAKPAAAKKPAAPKKRGPKGKPAPTSLKDSLKEPSGVEIWHAKDVELQPKQKRTHARTKRRSELGVWWIERDAFVQLGQEMDEQLTYRKPHRYAVALDNTPWEAQKRFGPVVNDVHLVDARTGKRTKVLEQTKFQMGLGPKARYLLYQKAGNYWTYDTQTKKHRNLTGTLDTTFVNKAQGILTDEPYPFGTAGWSKDGSQVYLYDRYDIWQVASNGSGAVRLTDGAEKKVRYRRVVLDREKDEFIDPTRPMIVSVYGDRTKRSGYARITGPHERAPRQVRRLRVEDAAISRLVKAKQAPVFAYVEETYADSPDIFVAKAGLESPRQLTKTNPFQKDYHWGRSELLDYTSTSGKELQAALYYPAGYEAGKTYPMVVDIYELRSQGLHRYSAPSERSAYNTSVYTTRGYFVLKPDIVYEPQNPGLSAAACVIPAVKAAIAKGGIDAKKVGLFGHSWGAYQAAFLVTQSDTFAAAAAGAPLTNMMSMSMNIYWNSGESNTRIFHESQGRMDRPFWRDVETYIKNSPIFHIEKLETPLLIAFGDKDGAVDWHQGIEMYNAARLAERPLVMLVYPGENHGLRQKPNQVDYHHRVVHWFEHHLKGVKAEPWVTKGKSYAERQKELEALKKKAGGPRGRPMPRTPPPPPRR